ncbi:muconate/chloromuconate family cycloisomerase [Novosphingobium album (ex Liu et al. 2023)]|uniref:Muconate/chloromuconate family cycloisomerase n=1 Tax=Novosphingobium album (ex Liu et al. 2023) TaxID=3031130 RepID=A0ABT5WPM9_9SPHN|nr:muconate/chloromuconate family cycloisomerase [Novosphingobium album (ex Liu et al. 2023)]MDE8652011.1 muconate/chloromuconate family cycloisomerase [Novosphingobium album (ex Liu et al. 2023)]
MPIVIDKVDTWIVDIPTIRPHVLSMTSISRQVMMLVFVHCSDGVTGLGEGTTIGGLSYGDESPEGMKLAIDRYCAPLLIGADASSPAAAMARVRAHVVGNHFAKNALETALLDAAARRAGLPLSALLGGRMRDRLPVLWTLASGDTARDIAEAETMIAAGRHDTFKLKIGKRAMARDIAHVAAIKQALGDRASVRVDVNQAWDEQTALRGAAMLADAGVDLIEQPLPHADRAGMARLTSRSRVPIMADEALRGPGDALDFARFRGADAFSIKPPQAGGLFAAGRIAAIATAGHIGVYGGTMLEGGIGTIAAAHLFSTFDRLEWGTELFGPLLQTEDILAEPLDYRDFSLILPDGPGLGVTLDLEKASHFRRDGPGRTAVSLSIKEPI